ncbi:hypothetical protein [Methyloglobulus sp.]|uniref:hypothetical protein n=1 Tax=Methyloglobulus sp. TaxID=2518622 RepID=UPI003989977F
MATKKKVVASEAAVKPKNSFIVEAQPGELNAAIIAKTIIRPEVQAALTMQAWENSADTTELAVALSDQIAELNKGDLKRPEAMLLMQAHTLDAIFNTLARKADRQEYMKNTETFLRLALKAQSQCRATLETLAAIKNPPVIFAKQANISSGHQQVNNGIPATHAGENKILPNELLEANDGSKNLDTGTTGATIAENKAMATLE